MFMSRFDVISELKEAIPDLEKKDAEVYGWARFDLTRDTLAVSSGPVSGFKGMTRELGQRMQEARDTILALEELNPKLKERFVQIDEVPKEEKLLTIKHGPIFIVPPGKKVILATPDLEAGIKYRWLKTRDNFNTQPAVVELVLPEGVSPFSVRRPFV